MKTQFQKIISFLIFFLSFIILSNCQQTSFYFMLKENQQECLQEYFPDKTLVIYDVRASEPKTKIQLTNPKSEILGTNTTNEFIYPFTTYEGGTYELCVTNFNRLEIKVEFSLKYGVGARDYSSIARTKDLKPIDLALEKLRDRAKGMSHHISFSQSNEKVFEKFLDNISSKIIMFSSLVMIVMIVIGYVETAYLKNFMRRRKII